MVLASQIRPGMAIAFEGQTYRVVGAEYHPGQGKMGGVTHAHLQNLDTRTLRDYNFRSDLKLQEITLDRQILEFLYADGDECCFMNPENFEQAEIPRDVMGSRAAVLVAGVRITVEYLAGRPVNVLFPDTLDAQIMDTAPPLHQQADSTFKPARLENGIEVMVPQFIKTGDFIRVNVETLKYVSRADTRAKAS